MERTLLMIGIMIMGIVIYWAVAEPSRPGTPMGMQSAAPRDSIAVQGVLCDVTGDEYEQLIVATSRKITAAGGVPLVSMGAAQGCPETFAAAPRSAGITVVLTRDRRLIEANCSSGAAGCAEYKGSAVFLEYAPQQNLSVALTHEMGHIFGLSHGWFDREDIMHGSARDSAQIGADYIAAMRDFTGRGVANLERQPSSSYQQGSATEDCPPGGS